MLILLPLTSIGQSILECKDNKYPITKIIDGDTVTLFSSTQEKCIYQWLIEKEICETELNISNVMIHAMDEHIDTLKSRIKIKDLEVKKYESKSIIDNKRITNLEEQLRIEKDIQDVCSNELKKVKRNRNKLYVIGGVIIAGLNTVLIISILK
jgi:nitrate reductase NapAB chaperone NapD